MNQEQYDDTFELVRVEQRQVRELLGAATRLVLAATKHTVPKRANLDQPVVRYIVTEAVFTALRKAVEKEL